MATPTIDLMILGALKEQSLSAYDMDKIMESRSLRKWVRVSSPSIYRNLIKLCKAGYAEGEVVREGSMPEKTIYTITDQGREHFDELMREVASAPVRVDFDFVAVIANLFVTDEKTGRELLHTLRQAHKESADKLLTFIPQVPRLEAHYTLELCARTYEMIAAWLERFEEDFYRDGVPADQRGWVGDPPKGHASGQIDDGSFFKGIWEGIDKKPRIDKCCSDDEVARSNE